VLIAPKWNTLMKHAWGQKEGKKGLAKVPSQEKEWYNNKTYRHKKNQAMFFIKALATILK
jgi:hypothetical protein